jgi:hypothetical protein
MRRFASFVLVMALAPVFAEGGVARVWAVSDGEKIEQDDIASALRARNSAWDGKTVRLFGARNEVLAFQVMVQADDRGIRALGAALPELRQHGGKGADGLRGPGLRSIADRRPAHRDLRRALPRRHGDDARRLGVEAGKPGRAARHDGLEAGPARARERARGPRRLPIEVAPSRNQGIWIEVYTPRDLPAGLYEGAVTVTADGRPVRVPVELQVFDFTLPDANSLDVMVYYEPSQPELYHGRNLDPAYHRYAHRNRIELVHAYDEAAVRASPGRFDGSTSRAPADTTVRRRRGKSIVPRSFYGPGQGWDERDSAWKLADSWITFLAGAVRGEDVLVHARRAVPVRVRAHPHPGRERPLQSGAGKALPVFVTKHWVRSWTSPSTSGARGRSGSTSAARRRSAPRAARIGRTTAAVRMVPRS